MILSKKNNFVRLYKFFYGDRPDDLCELTQNLFLAIILFPLSFVGRFFVSGFEIFKIGFFAWIFYFFSVLVGYSLANEYGYEFYGFGGNFLLSPLIGAGTMILGLGLLGVLVVGILMLFDGKNGNGKGIVTEWYKSMKGKYCVKIEYKKDENNA